MAKKRKIFNFLEVKQLAFNYLQKEQFGGVYPSDVSSNWNWGLIKDNSGLCCNAYGIFVRFGLQIFSVPFTEINFYPIFRESTDRIIGYVHFEDLTTKEKHELQVCGFFTKI